MNSQQDTCYTPKSSCWPASVREQEQIFDLTSCSYLLAEKLIDPLTVLHHALSSAHLLLSALRPGLQHSFHIPENDILMEGTQQGLQTGRKLVI